MTSTIRLKLILMMVLEFFIWGAWYPLIFGYLPTLGFTPTQQTWILSTFPVAAIIGMFFSNQFADRNFAAERFMAASHLIAGVAMTSLFWTQSFWPFFAAMLVHCLLYVPTVSITNSISFAHMKDGQKEFGLVRMGGTIGWVLAAWPMTFILVDWDKVHAAQTSGFVDWLGTVLGSGLTGSALAAGTKWVFIVAGIASFVLAAFSLTLPHTPPKKVEAGADKFAWLEALRLLAAPFILVLFVVTFIDSTVHNLFFNWTGSFLGAAREAGGVGIPGNWIMPVMSIGQVMEIATMAVLPQGRTRQRAGAVQPDDPRLRPARRQRDRPEADGGDVQDRDRRGLPVALPGAADDGDRRRGAAGGRVPSAGEQKREFGRGAPLGSRRRYFSSRMRMLRSFRVPG
jgi:hypothetical protein